MFRKAISLATVLVAAVLLFAQTTPTSADQFYATAITGHNGAYEVYTVGSASGNSASASGWVYFGMADGSWLDGSFLTLSVANNGDTSAVIAGWYYDAIPCYAYLTVKGGLASINIIGYGTNVSYVSSNSGSVYYGAFQAAKN